MPPTFFALQNQSRGSIQLPQMSEEGMEKGISFSLSAIAIIRESPSFLSSLRLKSDMMNHFFIPPPLSFSALAFPQQGGGKLLFKSC